MRIREEGGPGQSPVHLRTDGAHRHIIYHFKGNHLEIPTEFKVFKNILISRALEWVSKKFKLLKYEQIIHHFKARDLETPFI